MIRSKTVQPEPVREDAVRGLPADDVAGRVWGLHPRQIHDAYWRSHGVHCVHRGSNESVDPVAELYLLVEPRQLVLFDLADIVDRVVWNNARVTRLRLTSQADESYTEQIRVDETDRVRCIERHYRPRSERAYRVMLTRDSSLAQIWAEASTRRRAWTTVRRAVSWSRIDNTRINGDCYLEGESRDERDMLVELTNRWARPDQVIDGIVSVTDGVWRAAEQPTPHDATLIGPVWVGFNQRLGAHDCVVGPAVLFDDLDDADSQVDTVRLREIIEIESYREPSRIDKRPNAGGYAAAKRAFDIAFSACVLAAFLPIALIIGLCVIIDDGWPVFYAQKRQSRGGKVFRCWKFRTMKRNADQLVGDLAELNACDGPQVRIENDPRITRVGRVLRALQLDELPQFWNVLKGEMSVVGPRPSPDNENQFCPAWRETRLSVRPGITGMWQLKRTRAAGQDFQEWIRYDIEYVHQASFWLDMKICAQTAFMLLFGRKDNESHESR